MELGRFGIRFQFIANVGDIIDLETCYFSLKHTILILMSENRYECNKESIVNDFEGISRKA